LIAVQALWAGPWLTRVALWSPAEAAAGLFAVNVAMLLAFMTWGAVMPALAAKGVDAHRLMLWGLPLNLIVLAWIVARDEPAGAAQWALWCVTCTLVAPSQPAIGLAFPSHLAGRALSAYNLVIFGGVFAVQWGVGLCVDAFAARGMSDAEAFRAAFGLFGACGLLSYVWYAMWRPFRRRSDGDAADNRATAPAMTTRVVIVAHTPLANGLRAVALHTYPEHESMVSALDVQPADSPQDVETRLRALIGATPGADVLILADAAGATPCKAALNVVDGVRSRVVAGVNVPMLWRVLCYSGEPLPELVVRAVNGGTQGVLQLSTTPPQVQTPAPGSDDQEQHHHQQ
jgi:mannose/fructose-specific phosphotransferase system component IIA